MGLGDARSPEARAYRKLYWTQRWRTLRALQLRRHPICAMCKQAGRITEATVCDHVTPHKGDPVKFYAGPFQSLCKPCHDSAKAKLEARGRDFGCDAQGNPNAGWERE